MVRQDPFHIMKYLKAYARRFNRVPLNCEFEVDDAELEWTHPAVCETYEVACAEQHN
jgi:hypothetical protein